MLTDLLNEKKVSLYDVSKKTGIPYSTLSNIKLNKTNAKNISANNLYILAKYFNLSMEEIFVKLTTEYRMSFEIFKSEFCHKLKEMGDIEFVIYLLKNNLIENYWKKEWYAESFYLIALLDILCKKYNKELVNKYNYIRTEKLAEPLYPRDIIMYDYLFPEKNIKESILENCNKEFLKYNIIEGDIYDVV